MPNYAPLKKTGSALVVVDIQEKLLPVIHEGQAVLDMAVRMVKGAGMLGIPILFTQQYTKGLGQTHTDLRGAVPEFEFIEKMDFNAFAETAFDKKITELNVDTLVMIGTETHICVGQTALEGLRRGYGVHVLADAVGSRTLANKEIGLARIRQAGGIVSNAEMALFEWVGRSDGIEFKKILPLVK